MPRRCSMSMGTRLFISKLKFSYANYSVDRVWTKIYCHFYFRGITLSSLLCWSCRQLTARHVDVWILFLSTVQCFCKARCNPGFEAMTKHTTNSSVLKNNIQTSTCRAVSWRHDQHNRELIKQTTRETTRKSHLIKDLIKVVQTV